MTGDEGVWVQETEGERTRDVGTEDGKKRIKGQKQWIEPQKGTQGQLKEVRGRRITDGRQEADQVRQGKEDGGQGTERRQAGDREQGTRNRDVRQGI
jgi:hypothetical protein